MRSCLFATVAVLTTIAAAPAHADKKPRSKSPAAIVFARLQTLLVQPDDDLKPARFAFTPYAPAVDVRPDTADFEFGFWDDKLTVGFSADGKAAWLAADLAMAAMCGDESCYGKRQKPVGYKHATAVFEGGAPWQPVMWHVADVYTATEYAALAGTASFEPLPKQAGRGAAADAVVAQWKATIGDPAALAASVSPRADVVLYGTDRKERYVGGKKVAAQLRKWSLALVVRDELQAGVTASGTVAWIAANVDATSTKKPGARSSPYRVTAIYEQTAAGWQLVNLHFSIIS